ncbi:hypothetical protein BKA93DRAFT_753632 [Sparassis latifolia]
MTERYTYYLFTAAACGRKVRAMGNDTARMQPTYDQVLHDWYNDSTIILRTNSTDPSQQAAFFRQCNEICARPLNNLYTCFWVGFAATAGAQGLHCLFKDHPAKYKILKDAREESLRRTYGEEGVQELMNSASLLNPHPVDPTMNALEHVGDVVRYKDENNNIVECTIEDAGHSIVKGNFFKLSYGGGQKEVSYEEMALIWRNRV